MNITLQEVLIVTMIIIVFFGLFLAIIYVWFLTRFFKELQQKEPTVWEQVEKPSISDMLRHPMTNPRKYYAFIPVLRARRNRNYKYAGTTYRLLKYGVVVYLFFLANAMGLVYVFWPEIVLYSQKIRYAG